MTIHASCYGGTATQGSALDTYGYVKGPGELPSLLPPQRTQTTAAAAPRALRARHVVPRASTPTSRPRPRAHHATRGSTVPKPICVCLLCPPGTASATTGASTCDRVIVPRASTPTTPRPRRARSSCRRMERRWRMGGQVAFFQFR